LLIGCYRSEDVETSPFLCAYRQLRPREDAHLDRREVAVEPLSLPETEQLVRQLLGQETPALNQHTEALSREAGGNPIFVHELVQHLQAHLSQAQLPPGESLTLEEVIWNRTHSLPVDARRLLEVVAVAGRPLHEEAALEGAGLGSADRGALTLLRTVRLIRG